MKKEGNIHIIGPKWGVIEPIGQFLSGAAKVSSIIQDELRKDKEFARRFERLDPGNFNLDVDAILIVNQSWVDGKGAVVFSTSSRFAAGFTILQGCGLFKLTEQHYEFASPGDISVSTVKSAIYRLLNTQDSALHPENILVCVEPDKLSPKQWVPKQWGAPTSSPGRGQSKQKPPKEPANWLTKPARSYRHIMPKREEP